MKKYFGTDGIRGVASNDFFTLAYNIGLALKTLGIKKVIIGTDTRESKDELTYAIAKGAMETGLEVLDARIVPTSCLIYYSSFNEFLGVMITGSHNPFTDNGIKIIYHGQKISSFQEEIIEKKLNQGLEKYQHKRIKLPYIEIKERYLALLEKNNVQTKKLVVLDCSNGVATYTVEHAFEKIDHITVANKPNGKNINNNVGSTHPTALLNFVKENKADIGFAFDGDQDRVVAAMDNRIYDGDKLIYVIANYLHEKSKKPVHAVFTKVSNLGIINELNQKGIETSCVDVGHTNVLRELLNNDYQVGGENSGHIIIPEYFKAGDGVFTALFILRILEEENKSLEELTKDVRIYEEKTVNVAVHDKSVALCDTVQSRVHEISEILGEYGKVVVRPSGTENLVRISVQAINKDYVGRYADELKNLVESSDF